MPLADYVSYSAGFMPKKDAQAQVRCYEYLKNIILVLDQELKHDDSGANQQLENLRTIFEKVRAMIETASGSQRVARANTFWKYWDRNKHTIISVGEHTRDEYAIQDKMAELEEGRYTPS